jgi:hypothetical protein
VKLTLTNRPSGLTIKYLRRESKNTFTDDSLALGKVQGFPGDLSEGATPVPIPNTAVKPFSPDGTSR